MERAAVGDLLALVNACLNATSAVALAVGWLAIRGRDVRRHRAAMVAAVTASGVFLLSYLSRVAFFGTHTFAGTGGARAAYLAILATHIVLAIVVLPLVLRLLWLIRARRFHDHARLARWTLPVWGYVSVTGLIVYVMLYRVYGYL